MLRMLRWMLLALEMRPRFRGLRLKKTFESVRNGLEMRPRFRGLRRPAVPLLRPC